MAVVPERGFLLIADLTGYTAYLSSAEIEHAPTIAGDLIETIVGRLEPPFRLEKLEGDAAFLFVEDHRADASLLIDAVEAAYLAFRRRLRSIEQATACDCNACSRAPRLDLKFFVHHGEYVRTAIAGRDELAGSSIIVVHRLLKGATAQAAHAPDGRASGFAVLTGAAVAALGVDPAALGARAGREEIDQLGEVTTWTLDLEGRWQADSDQQRLVIEPDRAVIDLSVDVPSSAAVAWARLTAPALRPSWEGPIVIADLTGAGRRGVGTRSQCVTGRLATLEEIVDWQPYDHVGYRLAVPDVGLAEATYDLAASRAGTTVRLRWALVGHGTVDPAAVAQIRADREAGLRRLAAVLRIAGATDRSSVAPVVSGLDGPAHELGEVPA